MNLLGQIVFIYLLHYTAATSPIKTDMNDAMKTQWNQTLSTNMDRLPRFKKYELFNDMLHGDNYDSLAVLEWVNPVADTPAGFNLTTITHGFSGNFMDFRPCFIPSEKDIDFVYPIKVTYLNINRVLVYFKKEHKTKGFMLIPQVINPETCKFEEPVDTQSDIGSSEISVVPFKNTFDVIFSNQTLCPQDDSWCRMTFDHDGKKVGEPTSLFNETQNIAYVDNIYPINYESGKEGFVVATKKDYSKKIPSVYSPLEGWIKTENLEEMNHYYSNTSGHASVCWQTEDLRNIKCILLDGTNKTMTIPLNGRITKMPNTYNTPGGKIILLKEGRDNDKKVIFSDTAGPDGKCKRYMQIEFTDEIKRMELSIIDNETSCISFVSRDPEPIGQNDYSFVYAYKFTTKCVKFEKDFKPQKIPCGKDYLSK